MAGLPKRWRTWKDSLQCIIGVRNYIAHDYDGVNLTIIESDLRENMPRLQQIVEAILKEAS